MEKRATRPPVGAPPADHEPDQNADGKSAAATKQAILLLKLEGETRACKSTADLALLIANKVGAITRARQTFVLEPSGDGRLRITAATGLARIDANVPLIQSIEAVVSRLSAEAGLGDKRRFELHAYAHGEDETVRTYPFQHASWAPLTGKRGQLFAGLLMLRDDPWPSTTDTIVARLTTAFAHAWYWLATDRQVRISWKIGWKRAAATAAALLVVMLFPVSLTALAPAEIAPRGAFIVTAPIDGVIDTIPVDANSHVVAGATLVTMVDTNLRNRLAVAEREVQVTDAKVKRALLLAVSDARGRRDLAVARSELAVKIAERDYARELAGRAKIVAVESGLALFGDKRELLGKPVSTGEKVMEIADPARVELRIYVPVGDAIVLAPGARVKVFLDSAPLTPLEATIDRADYQARTHEGGILAFRVTASLAVGTPPPRLGIRGTAEIFGDRVPLIYYLLRRPIAALRQWCGL